MNDRTPYGPLNPNKSAHVAELIREVNRRLGHPDRYGEELESEKETDNARSKIEYLMKTSFAR